MFLLGDEIWLVGGFFPTDFAVLTIEANNQKNLSTLDLIYTENKYSMMNKPETPCTEFGDDFRTGHELYLKCSMKSFVNKLKNLPCLPGGINEELFQTKLNMKVCESTKQAKEVSDEIVHGKMLTSHSCHLPCQRTSYSFKGAYGHANSASKYLNDSSEIFVVYIYESSGVSEEKVETFVYDFFGLVSAIGGNMGLFLGFSCLSIALFLAKKLEIFGTKIWKSFCIGRPKEDHE
jgi:hypothetical protein